MAAVSESMSFKKVYLNYFLFLLYIITYSFKITEGKELLYPYVSCGSVLKLLNTNYKVRLHSHEVKYGSGSGQQSVTGTDVQEDINSHWVINGKNNDPCQRGEPVACGSTIRLEHLATHKNLHSHHFTSPLSGNQEVSAFGDDGVGDSGDYWVVMCNSEYWERDNPVRLKHVDTGNWLTISGRTYGRPIHGQMEVCAYSTPDRASHWIAAEGVYIKPNESFKHHVHQHTEL